VDDAHTTPRTLNLPERLTLVRALNRHGLAGVRLPGITSTSVCLGKQFGCPHLCCTTVPKLAPPAVSQPWDVRPAKHAA
jgi:hypothetical protein